MTCVKSRVTEAPAGCKQCPQKPIKAAAEYEEPATCSHLIKEWISTGDNAGYYICQNCGTEF
jgi:hypothetical protein